MDTKETRMKLAAPRQKVAIIPAGAAECNDAFYVCGFVTIRGHLLASTACNAASSVGCWKA